MIFPIEVYKDKGLNKIGNLKDFEIQQLKMKNEK
jgi:hypothetical protein